MFATARALLEHLKVKADNNEGLMPAAETQQYLTREGKFVSSAIRMNIEESVSEVRLKAEIYSVFNSTTIDCDWATEPDGTLEALIPVYEFGRYPSIRSWIVELERVTGLIYSVDQLNKFLPLIDKGIHNHEEKLYKPHRPYRTSPAFRQSRRNN